MGLVTCPLHCVAATGRAAGLLNTDDALGTAFGGACRCGCGAATGATTADERAALSDYQAGYVG